MAQKLVNSQTAPTRVFLAAALAGIAALFVWLPLDDMILKGVFQWHVLQPQTVEGGIEALALWGLLALVLLACRRLSLLAPGIALLIGLYLRRHHVDVPAVAAWLYLEALIAAGAAAERLARRSPEEDRLAAYVRWFLIGLTMWLVIALGASAAGWGSPGHLRVALVLVGAAAIALARRKPFAVHLLQQLPQAGLAPKLLGAYFLAFVACLMARTNVTVYHDSLWYGLRGEYVLAAEGSFFKSLGMAHKVHYYPKLFEVLLLPLSGLGDFSFPLALSVVSLVMIVLVCYLLARELGLDKSGALFAAALAGSIPAVANIALTTKPDLFATLLLMIASYYAWRYLKADGSANALLGLGSLALSLATKITSLPYGLLLLLGIVVGRGLLAPGSLAGAPAWRHSKDFLVSAWTFAGCVVALAGFTLRTLLLTGLPTVVPQELVRIWMAMGFALKYPVSSTTHERGKALLDIPEVVYDFLFRPTRLLYVQITWTANVWLYLAVISLLVSLALRTPRRPLRKAWIFAPVIVAGLGFALLYNNAQRGGDGNYYMFPLLLGTLLTFRGAAVRLERDRWILVACLVPFLAFHSLLTFVTACWAPGTARFDLNFGRSVFDTRETRAQLFRAWGLTKIGAFLAAQPRIPRVVGLGPPDVVRWLPARYEAIEVFRGLVETPAGFLHFLRSQHIDYLLLPRLRQPGSVGAIGAALQSLGQPEVTDQLFTLIDVRTLPVGLEALVNRSFDPPSTVHYELTAYLAEAEIAGQRPVSAPWGQAVARADDFLRVFTGWPTLVMAEETAVVFSLDPPPGQRELVLRAQVGLLPDFQIAGESDGVEVRASVTGREEHTVVLYITPTSGFQSLELPLRNLSGTRVQVRLAVANLPDKHSTQDWIVWVEPEIEGLFQNPE